MSERIQKYLSNLGYGSRREVEDWIVEGRLVVNGVPAEIGQKIDASDAVKLDGKRLSLKAGNEPLKVLIYKKRTGEMVTREDPEGRRTVFRKLPDLETGRWIAVGRLDVNTSGLLLMTNHGELARRLMHPSFEQRREYAVRALGELPEGFMQRLQSGVQLEDGPAHFESIRFGDNEIEDDESEDESSGGRAPGGSIGARANHWFVVTITEGRHREVRRLFESQGLTVNRLIRTAYGPIKLGRGIKSGSYREASKDEIAKLLDAVGLDHREALPERVRESHRERSEFPAGGKPKNPERAPAPASGKPAAKAAPLGNTGPKPKFRSGAEGWSRADRDERKQVERFERFEKDRPGVHRAPPILAAPPAKPWARKSAATPVGIAGEPEQFKARGFGAKSERSYAERGDSAPPPRRRESAEARPYKPRAEGQRPAPASKPYGERPRPAADGERPAVRPRSLAAEGRPAATRKLYGERPAYKPRVDRTDGATRPGPADKPYRARPTAGGEGGRPEFKPRPRRDEGASPRPSPARKPYGDRPARAADGERPAYRPRPAREDGGASPSPYARKPYGERPRPAAAERPAFRAREDRAASPGGRSPGERPAFRPAGKPASRAPAKPGQRYTVRDGKAVSGQGKPKLGLRKPSERDED